MSTKTKQTTSITLRPPVVTILGHVDHGKTTLLDTIRKTNIAQKEAGGITQHTGAYQVEVPSDSIKSNSPLRKITFIDTPGHEAFMKMRSRGIQVADIAILVIAANDGVMPQTIESLKLIHSAKIPYIIALNKIDLADTQTEKIKQQLVKFGVKLEEYGGDTPLVPISAKNALGIDKLLTMILLLAELSQVKENTPDQLEAVVIESSLSKNKGPVATIIVKSGTLSVGDEVVCENQQFKIRALTNWNKINIPTIAASDPAEVLGWHTVASVGSALYLKSNKTQPFQATSSTPVTSPSTTIPENAVQIILKSDTTGTREAILASLPPSIQVLQSAVGMINESDILLAKTTHALVIGFNMKPSDTIEKLAESEKVIIKTYSIIYELIEEIEEVAAAAISGNLAPTLGEAKILAIFPMDDQKIAGIQVVKGRTARGDQIKLVRNNEEIARARIKSIRHGKEDITKAEQGMEAGVLLSPQLPILTGDSIISIG